MATIRAIGVRGYGRPDRLFVGFGAVIIGFAAVVGVFRFFAGSPPDRGLQGVVANFAFAAVLAAPGLLVLLARNGRPELVIAAGVALLPLSMMSIVTVPLVIVAVVLFVIHPRVRWLPTVIVTINVVGFLVAAFVALIAHQDPRTYATQTVSGSTSDIITYVEALASMALTALAVGSGWWLASPERATR